MAPYLAIPYAALEGSSPWGGFFQRSWSVAIPGIAIQAVGLTFGVLAVLPAGLFDAADPGHPTVFARSSSVRPGGHRPVVPGHHGNLDSSTSTSRCVERLEFPFGHHRFAGDLRAVAALKPGARFRFDRIRGRPGCSRAYMEVVLGFSGCWSLLVWLYMEMLRLLRQAAGQQIAAGRWPQQEGRRP